MGRKKKAIAKAYAVRISKKAEQNIDEITGYISFIRGQPLNAVKVSIAFEETIDRIARNPHAYKVCSEIPTASKIYRRANCLSWAIIYKIKADEIIVLGVIHQSCRPSRFRSLKKVK
jgi:plasmid stabilization system protein ParE